MKLPSALLPARKSLRSGGYNGRGSIVGNNTVHPNKATISGPLPLTNTTMSPQVPQTALAAHAVPSPASPFVGQVASGSELGGVDRQAELEAKVADLQRQLQTELAFQRRLEGVSLDDKPQSFVAEVQQQRNTTRETIAGVRALLEVYTDILGDLSKKETPSTVVETPQDFPKKETLSTVMEGLAVSDYPEKEIVEPVVEVEVANPSGPRDSVLLAPSQGASEQLVALQREVESLRLKMAEGQARPTSINRTLSVGGSSASNERNSVLHMEIGNPSVAPRAVSNVHLSSMFHQRYKEIVESTWASVLADRPEEFIQDFYAYLFQLMPETKLLFKNGATRQNKAMIGTMSQLLASLNRSSQLDGEIKRLAKTHANLGITHDMFDAFGAALVDTMGKRMGESWSNEGATAWHHTYCEVATLLQDQMDDVKPRPGDMPKWLRRSYASTQSTLKQTWEKANRNNPELTANFYANYFEVCPEAIEKFMGDARKQRLALSGSISQMITLLGQPHKLASQLQRLAASHQRMGITEHMFRHFADALCTTLKQALGDSYTNDVHVMWVRALRLLVDGMVSSQQKEDKCTIS